MEDVPRTSLHADIARLDHLEGENRGVHQVAQFVSEKSKPLRSARGLSLQRRLIPLAPVFGDGACNRVVETSGCSMRKSSVLIGAFIVTASSVID